MTKHLTTRLLAKSEMIVEGSTRNQQSNEIPSWRLPASNQTRAASATLIETSPSLSCPVVSYAYEQKVSSQDDPNDFRLPDFTVSFEGDTFYWEHLGMLSVPSYEEAWDRSRQWYEYNGYLDRVILSEDGPDGSIDAAAIEKIACKTILLEG